MCLQSGLLAESSWALDSLAIFTSDELNSQLFMLEKLPPTFLDQLLEWLVVTLYRVFGSEFEDEIKMFRDAGGDGSVDDEDLIDADVVPDIMRHLRTSSRSETRGMEESFARFIGRKNVDDIPKARKSEKGNTKPLSKPKPEMKAATESQISTTQRQSSPDSGTASSPCPMETSTSSEEVKDEKEEKPSPITEVLASRVLNLIDESDEQTSDRLIVLSGIFRNLSFIRGNDLYLARNKILLRCISRLLKFESSREAELPPNLIPLLRENFFIILSNIAGYVDFARVDDLMTVRGMLDALAYWATTEDFVAHDPFPVAELP